jgi:hypothetical protein
MLNKYNGRVFIDIGLHNEDRRESVIQEVTEFLALPIKQTIIKTDKNNRIWQDTYNSIKADHWPECNTPDNFNKLPCKIRNECKHQFGFSDVIFNKRSNAHKFVDINNVSITIYANDMFDTSALTVTNGVFTPHNSDPEKSHDICYSKKCHHFIKGKLYKCGPVALFPEFYKQFHFNISKTDKDLMHSYNALNSTDTSIKIDQFISNLGNAIPQCKFCPDQFTGNVINATTSKARIKKK